MIQLSGNRIQNEVNLLAEDELFETATSYTYTAEVLPVEKICAVVETRYVEW